METDSVSHTHTHSLYLAVCCRRKLVNFLNSVNQLPPPSPCNCRTLIQIWGDLHGKPLVSRGKKRVQLHNHPDLTHVSASGFVRTFPDTLKPKGNTTACLFTWGASACPLPSHQVFSLTTYQTSTNKLIPQSANLCSVALLWMKVWLWKCRCGRRFTQETAVIWKNKGSARKTEVPQMATWGWHH